MDLYADKHYTYWPPRKQYAEINPAHVHLCSDFNNCQLNHAHIMAFIVLTVPSIHPVMVL